MLGILATSAQIVTKRRRVPETAKPECAKGAICFAGEVREGGEFRRPLTPDLDFVLDLPGGFDVVSRHVDPNCKLSAWVANPPLRAHHETEIDAAYDWTAEQEVEDSTREFRFTTNCADFNSLFNLSETDAGKYLAELQSLAKGHGRLWITDSKVSHSHGNISPENGAVEWIKFSVEIKLPSPN